MSEAGQIDFAVYGYMSRGNHEGTTGIALYRYETAGNALTERLYLPASTDYGNLRQDINQLCYLSGGQTLYVLMNHAVYSVDLTGKEYMVVADGLTEENFAVSTDASRIAWQDGADIYRSTKLHVMNLETGKKDEISFPGSDRDPADRICRNRLSLRACPSERAAYDGWTRDGASAVCGRDRRQQYGDGDPL
ncbi:MAG: hypothetical protein ACLT76_15935 [Clostridium fessum]